MPTHSIHALLRRLAGPDLKTALGRWLPVLAGLHAAVLLLLSWANGAGAERWWWSAVNLYLPQWVWGLPALLLLPLLLRWRRWAALLPLLALVWVAGPLMGFRPPHAGPAAADGPRLRVMTFNVGGSRDVAAVMMAISRTEPDVVFLQESTSVPGLHPALAATRHLAGFGCAVASRFPLEGVEVRPLRNAPEWRTYVRCRIRVEGRPVTLCGVHLDTPREGFEAMRRAGPFGDALFQAFTGARLSRGYGVAIDLRTETDPLVVAGDFNAPPPSMLLRPFRALRLQDAFEAGSWGYGYTYGHRLHVGPSFVRIDHILAGPEWRVRRCWTGDAGISDHRPVIADLVLTGS